MTSIGRPARPMGACVVGIACLFGIAALAGCGGADETPSASVPPVPTTLAEPDDDDSSTPPDSPAVIATNEGALPGQVREVTAAFPIDTTVHYAGFDVEIDQVTVGTDPAGFEVAQVDVMLTNRSARRDRLDTAVGLTSGGIVAVIDRDGTPDVEPGASVAGWWSLRLPDGFAADAAVLEIGRSDRVRAEVPLTDPGDAVTLEPKVFTDIAAAEDEVSSVRLVTVAVTTDTAMPRAQAVPGRRFLVVGYELTSSVATVANDDVWELLLPGGETVAPISTEGGRVDADAPTIGFTATFSVPDPTAGMYELRYTERFGNGGLDIPFVIPG